MRVQTTVTITADYVIDSGDESLDLEEEKEYFTANYDELLDLPTAKLEVTVKKAEE